VADGIPYPLYILNVTSHKSTGVPALAGETTHPRVGLQRYKRAIPVIVIVIV